MPLNFTHKEISNLRLLQTVSILTRREAMILALLVEGTQYKDIAARLGVNLSCIHTHTSHIRQKTGIRNTQNPRECAKALVDLKSQEPTATPKQMEVLTLLAAGKGYREIASTLNISHQTAQNHASHGCKRVGINSPHGRTTAIRAYLERLEAGEGKAGGSPLYDPMF